MFFIHSEDSPRDLSTPSERTSAPTKGPCSFKTFFTVLISWLLRIFIKNFRMLAETSHHRSVKRWNHRLSGYLCLLLAERNKKKKGREKDSGNNTIQSSYEWEGLGMLTLVMNVWPGACKTFYAQFSCPKEGFVNLKWGGTCTALSTVPGTGTHSKNGNCQNTNCQRIFPNRSWVLLV